MIYDYQIGLVSGSMVKLENLALSGSPSPVDYPKSTYRPYSDQIILVSGLVRGVGYPQATWGWSVIPAQMRDTLRQYCPGQSANVYIRTRTMDSNDSYANFSAIMVWPTQDEERDSLRRVNFQISFRNMVAV